MRKLSFSFLALAGLLIAAETPKPRPEDTSRTVHVSEKSVVAIKAGIGETTLVVLPEGEKVTAVFGGNKEDWLIQPTEVPTRYFAVKAKTVGAQTVLHVISDHGQDYTFSVSEVSASNTPYDAKVFIDPDSQIQQQISQPVKFLPASDVETYKKKADEAQAQVESLKKQDSMKLSIDEEQFRSQYPGKLNFGYRWNQKDAEKFGVQQIFDDGKFLYIKAHPQEAPALYEMKDGKPSLISFDFNNGVYTVTHLVNQGYLQAGKAKMEFTREATN